jgi:hypothetical protein
LGEGPARDAPAESPRFERTNFEVIQLIHKRLFNEYRDHTDAVVKVFTASFKEVETWAGHQSRAVSGEDLMPFSRGTDSDPN